MIHLRTTTTDRADSESCVRRRLSLALPPGATAVPQIAAPDAAGEWIQLFNGRDLTGWTPKIVGHTAGDNYADTFRVEDGVLRVSYDQLRRAVQRPLRPPVLQRAVFELHAAGSSTGSSASSIPAGPIGADANSGIMIHGQTPESMGRDQILSRLDRIPTAGRRRREPRPTGNVCTPGTHIVLDGKLFTHPLHQQHEQDLSRSASGSPPKSKSTATS